MPPPPARVRAQAVLAVLVSLLPWLAPSRRAACAEDDEGSAARVRLDLAPLRLPAAPTRTRLWAPSDHEDDASFNELQDDGEGAPWQFPEPPSARGAVPFDAVERVLTRFVPALSRDSEWRGRQLGDAILGRGGAGAVDAAKGLLDRLVAAVGPRLAVSARLFERDDAGRERPLASVDVRVAPRRWTTLWSDRRVVRRTVGYDVEIAQESCTHVPIGLRTAQGSEVHLRWTPGETVSLLEVYASTLVPAGVATVDLAGLRDVPEANAMDVVEHPRTAVRRAYAVALVPVQGGSGHLFSWGSPDAAATLLRLEVSEQGAPPADVAPLGPAVGFLRVGAVNAPLGWGDAGRPGSTLQESLDLSEDAFGPARDGVELTEAVTAVSGRAEQLRALRAAIGRAETSLVGASVAVEAVLLPDDADRAAVVAGRTVDPAVAAAWSARPGARVASAQAPVVHGVPTSLRSGASVVGFVAWEGEVAQQTGALVPLAQARFSGLFATTTALARSDGGFSLHVDGGLRWAVRAGSVSRVGYRLPVSMRGDRPGPEDTTMRRYALDVLATGETALAMEARYTAEDVAARRPVVLATAPWRTDDGRDGVVVVFATLSR